MAPRLDLTTTPYQPPVYARLGLNRDTCSSDRSPSPDGPGPRTFVQNLQQVPLPPRSDGGRGKGKAKRQDQDEGPSTQRGKKNRKDRRRPANSALVAMADHTGKQPQQSLLDHFNKLMESPCTNHAYPMKHLYKDCELLRRFLRQAGRPKEGKGKEAAAKKGGVVGKDTTTEVIRLDAYRLKDDNDNVLTNTWNIE